MVADASQPANARLGDLIHETIHALGIGYAEYGRERTEVIVDTATYLAAASALAWMSVASRFRMSR